ncbi:MAG: FeoB-associated Cys-rich membrane protein [Eubacterium sp.]|nr:FeoB-associated Cys-rich membrane protein [Eubacterium sp.]
MLQFFQNNYGTVIALLIIAVLAVIAVRRIVLNKKEGKGSCGQSCSNCPKAGSCEAFRDKK